MSANNISEIRELLDRYYDGNTTETEEMTLRAYFTQEDNIPADLEADRLMFNNITASPEQEIPEGLNERLLAKIDEWNAAEKAATKTRKRIRIPRLGVITGIAASLIVLISIGICLQQPTTPTAIEPTPEEAYAQTEKALRIFANAIDKSMEQIETVEKTSAKVNRQINRQLDHLNDI